MATSTYITVDKVTEQQINAAYSEAESVAKSYSFQYDSDMRSNQLLAQTLAHTMENYDSNNRNEVNTILKSLLEENQGILGTYVAYENNAFDGMDAEFANTQGHDTTGRFIPYWSRSGSSVALAPLAGYETDDYYQLPKSQKQDVILEPFLYDGEMMVSYVSPVIKNGDFIGISGVDVSLDYIDEEVSQVKFLDTGYAFIVSNSGLLISSPTEKEWIGTMSLTDFNDPVMDQMTIDIKNGKGGRIGIIDPITGKEVSMTYEPMETADFAFVLVTPYDEMIANAVALRDQLIIISLVAIIAMAGIAFLIARSVTKPIEGIVKDFDDLAKDTLAGKLDRRADTNVAIDFEAIPRGFNQVLEAVVVPLNEAARVINSYAEGDLSTRGTIDAKGDFKLLGDTLDGFGDTLQSIINDSCEVLASISSNDLTKKVSVHGVGDFVQLTEGVENCRLSLNEVVTLVTENAENIASTAQEMSAASEELTATAEQISGTISEISKGTQAQSGKAVEVSRAMDDMSLTVQEVATNSGNAAQNAIEANTLIQGLGEMSQDLKLMMESIKSAVGESSDVINELDEKSKQIGEIVNLITSIADQTNLLALNAAIEAARAGEHGRGFAVVADEVRKLAEDSGNAAKQIAQLIDQMQAGTQDAVSSMGKGLDEVDTGAVSLEKSVLAIGKVVEGGDTIAKMVQDIAAAAQEQSASIEEVTSSVEEVSAISEQSAAEAQEASASVEEQTASMQELSNSAQELAGVAANMQLVVSKFRLDTAGADVLMESGSEGSGKRENPVSSKMKSEPSELLKNALV
ncbi:methyl-accepting chemotaxis protein [Methanolobus sp. ZRKC4]|uniref:methyl-accepting chemotaxis protein n=1 Tax=Methanolobus sp. ZRKC4 TaxID=3125787 RepID=UPI00324A1234